MLWWVAAGAGDAVCCLAPSMTDRWLRAELADVTCDEATLRFALLDVNGSTCAQERLESAESENGAGIELAPARHMLLLRVHDAYARYVSAVEPFAREMDEIRAAQAARSHARSDAAAMSASESARSVLRTVLRRALFSSEAMKVDARRQRNGQGLTPATREDATAREGSGATAARRAEPSDLMHRGAPSTYPFLD